MPLTDDIAQQQGLLQTYRRRLVYHLEQQARLGSMTPFSLVGDIQDAREQIHRVKLTLREWGVEVEDHPNDDEALQARQGTEAVAYMSPRAKFLLSRLQFLNMLDEITDDMLDQHVKDLADYVSSLEMGSYYAQKMREVMERISYGYSLTPGDPSSMRRYHQAQAKHDQEYREKLRSVRAQIYALADELIQFQ